MLSIISIIGAVLGSGVVIEIARAVFNKKKIQADAASTTVVTILEWATKLSARIDVLEGQLLEKDVQIDQLITQLHKQDLLIQELREKGK